MAERIEDLVITASNASKVNGQVASVTVRDLAGNIKARIYSERSQPLKWLRRWPHSQERLDLISQLRKEGIDAETIQKIVSL